MTWWMYVDRTKRRGCVVPLLIALVVVESVGLVMVLHAYCR